MNILADYNHFVQIGNHTERHAKPFQLHTQRSACWTLCCSFKTNDSKGEYAIYHDAVYNSLTNEIIELNLAPWRFYESARK